MRMLETFLFFFFNDTATTEIYTLSLHDALPIWGIASRLQHRFGHGFCCTSGLLAIWMFRPQHHQACVEIVRRSEEHTSELQSLAYLVCRLLLEKKKRIHIAAFLDDIPLG